MIELVMVVVIVGVLAVYAVPRFSGSSAFQSRGFADQVQASLRYAQKIAIAQHRFTCVAIAGNSLSLSVGTTAACGTPLTSLSGSGSYTINAPSGVTVANAAFNFDALGKPSAAQSIAVSGYASPVIVEAETGYVHQ